MDFFFKGNIPSFKNSKRIFRTKTGKTILTHSKAVQKYLDEFEGQWEDRNTILAFRKQLEGKEKPYKIGFFFVREDRRRFDYINMLQLPQDLMVKHGFIEDDNCNEIIPVVLGYKVDKNNSGILIKILD